MAAFANPHVVQECETYTSFCCVMDNIRERYSELHPKTGAVCGTDKHGPLASYDGPPSETTMEYIRGGIVSTIAAWEAMSMMFLRRRLKELSSSEIMTSQP